MKGRLWCSERNAATFKVTNDLVLVCLIIFISINAPLARKCRRDTRRFSPLNSEPKKNMLEKQRKGKCKGNGRMHAQRGRRVAPLELWIQFWG